MDIFNSYVKLPEGISYISISSISILTEIFIWHAKKKKHSAQSGFVWK